MQKAQRMEYGVYGRVLFCGQLEKRRDGAVRGGWASRLFLLTPDALHYFRKIVDSELLGEERGMVDTNARFFVVGSLADDDLMRTP